ncbi:MAG: MarR family winged helix-turn-helix transcriptional regulator [Smithellaceae bacterium]
MKEKITLSLDESPGFWLYRCHIQVSAALRQAFQDAGYDLTPEQGAVLLRLREQEGLNQSQLAEKTYKDRHNITRILKQLERRGYIEKRHDKEDKRAFRIYLSLAGRSILKGLKPIVLKHRDRMCKGFSKDELVKIRDYLGHIISNLRHS